MNDALSWILETVQSVDPALRILIAGVGMLLETSVLIGLIVPGDSILLAASTAVADPLHFVILALTVIVGALAGETIGFALGRYFGPRFREGPIGRRLGEKNWIRAENYVARRGGIAVFLSRFLPFFHSLIPLTVGMSGMRYRRFIAWTIPACAIWSFAYISVGAAAAGSYRQLSSRLNYAGFVFAGIIVAFLLVAFAIKKLLQRMEAKHMEARADAQPPAGPERN